MNKAEKEAVKLMQQLDIDQCYIDEFEQIGIINLFGNLIDCQVSDIRKKTKLIDKLGNTITCYATIFNKFPFGKCFTLLVVPKNEEYWSSLVRPLKDGTFLVYAYIINLTDENSSEYGYVQIASEDGELRRIA